MRFAAVALLAACGSGAEPPRVLMDLDRPTSFYDAPFPSDDLRAGDTIDLSGFPNPDAVAYLDQCFALLADADGFATTGGVFFRTTEPLDEADLPDIAATAAGERVFLVDIDAASPERGRSIPAEVRFQAFEELYGASNLLTLVPVQGIPLRPGTRYAAVVQTSVRAADGRTLAPADPEALAAHGADVAGALTTAGVDLASIAGLTVFTTGHPTAELDAVVAAALDRPLPQPLAPFTRTDLHDDFCVYQTTVMMPVWQAGDPPYDEGGGWTFDDAGAPIFQREEEARLVVSLPRAALPAAGYPLVVFVRTGGGGDRPLVDRGQRDADGNPLEPGEGPARYLARAGFAGMQVDGPLGGIRNLSGGDEQFLIFNVQNLAALRDNVRQSAVELALLAHIAGSLQLAAADCPPAGTTDPGPAAATFDLDHLALMGHSMGATIGPLVVAAEPRYGALILSGAGGSWIENIMYKRKPLEVRPVIELLLHESFALREDDPALTLAQWALEPADPPVYAPRIVAEPSAAGDPRHLLMQQGIVDNYILPRIANATSLSLRLDLAGEAHDDDGDPRLDGQSPLGPLLPLVGGRAIDLPAAANAERPAGAATAVVLQHLEDGVEDGHEVLFQNDAPKHQVQCFLASWLAGSPSVPVAADRDAPCP